MLVSYNPGTTSFCQPIVPDTEADLRIGED